jgi:hypothetical protein
MQDHRTLLVSSLLILISFAANATKAQTEKPSPQPSPPATSQPPATPPPPEPNPADVSSIDAIINAVYEVHSAPAGAKRDWNRFRSLFVPGARLIPTGPQRSGEFGWRLASVDGYITHVGPSLEKDGFFEKEVARRTETWANMAQVFSVYESRRKADDPKPFMRGINSIQLLNDGKRWWIVTVMWQNEDEKNKLPDAYLKHTKR